MQSFSGLAASLFNAFNVGQVNAPRRIFGEYVSGNYFAVLGVTPVRGRAFVPAESGDNAGASPVVVIGYRLWQDLFHGDPGVVGKTVRVNRFSLTVAGVAPPEFRGTMPGMAIELWIPMNMAPTLNGRETGCWRTARSGRCG
ncbi:MAG: ABC transporter permease [Ignavibacteriota bacterium]